MYVLPPFAPMLDANRATFSVVALQRVERMNRDGENSPARLTMAQAALLNLKGTQLGSRLPSPNFGVVGLPPVMAATPPLVEPAFVATQSGTIKPLPPPIGLHHQQQVDASSLSPLIHTAAPYADGNMLGMGALNPRLATEVDHIPGVAGLRAPYVGGGATDAELLQMRMASMDISGVNAPAALSRVQNGYTQMERLILQAHEQRQQQEAQLLAAGGVFGQNANVSNVDHRFGAGQQRASEFNPAATEFNPTSLTSLARLKAPITAASERRRLVDFLPAMSEKDFHARGQQLQQKITVPKVDLGVSLAQPEPPVQAMSKPLTLDHDSRVQFTRQRNQTHAEARAQAQAEAEARARSTTMPSHYLNTDISRSIHGSIHSSTTAAPGSTTLTSVSQDVTKTNNDHTGRVVSSGDTVGTASDPDNNTIVRNLSGAHRLGGNISSSNSSTQASHSTNGTTPSINDDLNATRGAPAKADASTSPSQPAQAPQSTRIDTTTTAHSRHVTSDEDEDDGSGLDSPALSYSARTPASLSPATPFSAFGETFEGPPMARGHEVGLGMGVSDVAAVGVAKQAQAQAPPSKLNIVVSTSGAGTADH